MEKPILRPLEDADIPLLKTWLRKEYILRWYHDADEWLHEVRRRRDAFWWIHHFIALDGDAPMGFCQYYDCYHAQEDWYCADRPGDTFSIDYLIGEEAWLGKGYGKALVALLTERVRSGEKARRIVVQPEEGNAASCGALLANGYVYDPGEGYYCKIIA